MDRVLLAYNGTCVGEFCIKGESSSTHAVTGGVSAMRFLFVVSLLILVTAVSVSGRGTGCFVSN